MTGTLGGVTRSDDGCFGGRHWGDGYCGASGGVVTGAFLGTGWFGEGGEGCGGGGEGGVGGDVGFPGGLGVGLGEGDDEEGFEKWCEAEVDAIDGV